MDLRRDLALTVGVLVFLNLSLAFGAIGLFARMGPAIARIMDDNVYSIVAMEEIVSELAMAGPDALSDETRRHVGSVLQKAQDNVTEAEERPALEALARTLPAAMNGDVESRRSTIVSAREIIRINRTAMREVNADARRLGAAGGWTAVFVGFVSFVLSIFMLNRLQNRFVRPLLDLHDVLEGAAQGDRFRRCRLAEAPREVLQVSHAVNRLLDQRLERTLAE